MERMSVYFPPERKYVGASYCLVGQWQTIESEYTWSYSMSTDLDDRFGQQQVSIFSHVDQRKCPQVLFITMILALALAWSRLLPHPGLSYSSSPSSALAQTSPQPWPRSWYQLQIRPESFGSYHIDFYFHDNPAIFWATCGKIDNFTWSQRSLF